MEVSGLIEANFPTYTGGGSFVSVAGIFDGNVHLVVITYDPGTGNQTISIDGGTRSVGAVAWGITSTQGLWLAIESFLGTLGSPWDGSLSNVMILNRAITTDEEKLLYNSGCGCLYDQIPCSLVDNLAYYFPLGDQNTPFFTDVYLGGDLTPGPDPIGTGQAPCGDRVGCVAPPDPTVPLEIKTIDIIDYGGSPTPPAAGILRLTQTGDIVFVTD